MPQLHVGERSWSVASASNLLDALNHAGVPVPYSCRAGSCHACLVRCVKGEPEDALPDALPAEKRQQGGGSPASAEWSVTWLSRCLTRSVTACLRQ